MKYLPFFLIYLMLLCAYGCRGKQNYISESDSTQSDSIFVNDFYKSINGLSIEEFEPMISRDILEIDSTYFIEYDFPINGYAVKAILKDLRQVSNIEYTGYAYIWFFNSNSTRFIFHPTFSLSDSVVAQLKVRKVNQLKYDLIRNDNYNINELGQFGNVPFAFFDVNFDGKKELLLRHSYIGQRGTSTYTPYQPSISDSTLYNEIFIGSPNDLSIDDSGEITYCLVLDDLTEFDVNNKEIIMNLLVGWNGNQKIYFKVANRIAILYKIETFNKQWEQLVKRATYTNKGAIIEQFE